MTDEELLSIVNLKTGHYTHDELQAAREEFIRRMYREPLIPEREVPRKEEAPVFKEEIKAEPFFEKEPEDFVPPAPEEEMREYLTEAEAEFLKESTKEAFEAPATLTEPVSFESQNPVSSDTIDLKAEPMPENFEQTRTFTPAETMVLEQKTDEEILGQSAEQIGFFEEEKTIFEEFASHLTEEDYAFYERQRPIVYCSTDTKLNKFCRRFVIPLVCTKTFVTLLIALFAVISNHKSLTFNLYACSAFVFMVLNIFAWDALVNDINPIIPKITLSCELLLALTNVFSGTYIVPAILVWLYIIAVLFGLAGLFPSKES